MYSLPPFAMAGRTKARASLSFDSKVRCVFHVGKIFAIATDYKLGSMGTPHALARWYGNWLGDPISM